MLPSAPFAVENGVGGTARVFSEVAEVYRWCMARTNIDLDDEACSAVMHRYHLSTKRDAVNFALRIVAAEALGLDEARQLRGSGWDGDLDELRSGRVP
jgi:Arc/MetJ family transcription regulator